MSPSTNEETSSDFEAEAFTSNLKSAIDTNEHTILQSLLKNNPKAPIPDDLVRNAIYTSSIPTFHTFLTHDPSILNKDHNRRGTTLEIAISSQSNKDFLLYLLETAHADPNVYSGSSLTPLALAAGLYDTPDTVKLLLSHGARIKGSGAIAAAAKKGRVDTLKVLLDPELGGDVNDPGQGPIAFLPLHCAVKYKQLEVVRVLIERGADLGLEDSDGKTAVGIAEEMGYAEGLEVLRDSE